MLDSNKDEADSSQSRTALRAAARPGIVPNQQERYEQPAMFKESAIANLVLSLAPMAIGHLMSILLPGAMKNPRGYAPAAIAFYGVGFVFFAAAKIQNIRKGHLHSFGSSRMSAPWKLAYRFGYVLMGLGLFLPLGY
jgi:hypothetical protein